MANTLSLNCLRLIPVRDRILSIPQWAGKAALADDGKSIATARKLVTTSDGPVTTKIRRIPYVKASDHQAWAQATPWAEYLASLPAFEREQRQSQAMRIVGNAKYVTLLYERFCQSRWRFQMTFEKWLKRRQRLKDRHTPRRARNSMMEVSKPAQ